MVKDMQYEQKKNKSEKGYMIVPIMFTVDARHPYGFGGGSNSSCISLPCRNCQTCHCVGCKKMSPSLEEISAEIDSKQLFAELLAA